MHSPLKSKISKKGTDPAAHFRKFMLKWYAGNRRSYPWVGEKDPYKVWLSEIILQQTRTDQGLPYYERILARYPSVDALAGAPEQEVFRLWQGLGYYNRCKNMLAAARIITADYKGQFPDTYEEILALPGVGPYTAAAIASFAFDLPYAVVDGNVERLFARYFGIAEAVNTTKGKKRMQTLATALLLEQEPASYNQAVMDFGATVCRPKMPLCTDCPFQIHCVALREGRIATLPVKKPKRPVKQRFLHYYVFQHEHRLFVQKRPDRGIWQNLHEFLLWESPREESEKQLLKTTAFRAAVSHNKVLDVRYSPLYRHQLTHQMLHIRFLAIRLQSPPRLPEGFFPLQPSEVDDFAFPRPLVRYLASLRANG